MRIRTNEWVNLIVATHGDDFCRRQARSPGQWPAPWLITFAPLMTISASIRPLPQASTPGSNESQLESGEGRIHWTDCQWGQWPGRKRRTHYRVRQFISAIAEVKQDRTEDRQLSWPGPLPSPRAYDVPVLPQRRVANAGLWSATDSSAMATLALAEGIAWLTLPKSVEAMGSSGSDVRTERP